MKTKDIRKKSTEDLKKLVKDSEVELREFRFGMAGAGKKNVKQAKDLKKTIAQAKTILSENKSQ